MPAIFNISCNTSKQNNSANIIEQVAPTYEYCRNILQCIRIYTLQLQHNMTKNHICNYQHGLGNALATSCKPQYQTCNALKCQPFAAWDQATDLQFEANEPSQHDKPIPAI